MARPSRGMAEPGGQTAALPGPPPPLGEQRPAWAPPRLRRARRGGRSLPAEGPAPTGPALPCYLQERWPSPARSGPARPGPPLRPPSPLPPAAHPPGLTEQQQEKEERQAGRPLPAVPHAGRTARVPLPTRGGITGAHTRSPRLARGPAAGRSSAGRSVSRCPASTRSRPPAPTGRAARRSQPQRQTFPSARPRAPPPAGSGGGAGVRPGPHPLKGEGWGGEWPPPAVRRGSPCRAEPRRGCCLLPPLPVPRGRPARVARESPGARVGGGLAGR